MTTEYEFKEKIKNQIKYPICQDFDVIIAKLLYYKIFGEIPE